jgi:acetylornithine deacetylase
MYGRGAADMKAGIAAYVTAFKALKLAGLQPAAELQMAAVVEEECTGNGALAVMEALPKPDACLIPEPGPGYPALYTAEVGVVWAWVTVTGRPVHVREMHAGINAIEAAYIISSKFKEYEAEMNAAERRHPAFAADNHPININLGTIQGGEWNSSVPTRTRIGLRVGVMPGHSCREVAREIERLVAEAGADPRLASAKISLEFKGFMADGCVFPADQPIAQAVSACHAEVFGAALRHYNAAGLTDARHYVLYQNTQATCYGPDSENIHGIDESVGLDSLYGVTQAIALTIAGWCGVEAVE